MKGHREGSGSPGAVRWEGRCWWWLGKVAGLSLAEEEAPSSLQSQGQGALGRRGGTWSQERPGPQGAWQGPHLPDAVQEGIGHEAVVLVASAARVIFLKRSVVFPILMFSSISLH